jgi:hypothetical protein
MLDQQSIPVVGEAAQSFTVILFAQTDRFRAEIKNAAADPIVRLDATSSAAAATGNVGMIGWDLLQSASLERLVAGPPSARAAAILAER